MDWDSLGLIRTAWHRLAQFNIVWHSMTHFDIVWHSYSLPIRASFLKRQRIFFSKLEIMSDHATLRSTVTHYTKLCYTMPYYVKLLIHAKLPHHAILF